ncbi:MAG: hypothetical protein CK427_09860 [Leptospira sp.]|jgi:hypothetical protein|nr:MAG: hypothetical protein CK427_09860 [Leptospira sp.]
MKHILKEKQKYLIGLGCSILMKDFSLSSEDAKKILFEAITKELKLAERNMDSFDSVSRAERHTFIRRVANDIGEQLIVKFKFNKIDVSEKISKFMIKMNEQSQLFRTR